MFTIFHVASLPLTPGVTRPETKTLSSKNPSLLSSSSALSPIPSLSESIISDGSSGKSSNPSITPSSSVSLSNGFVPITFSLPSPIRSLSESNSQGSVPFKISSTSKILSLSSSSSTVSPIPSESQSVSFTLKIVLIESDVKRGVAS